MKVVFCLRQFIISCVNRKLVLKELSDYIFCKCYQYSEQSMVYVRNLTIIMILYLTLSLISCDGGLAPKAESEKSFLTGTVVYKHGKSKWPPADSILAVRAAAFKKYPDSTGILNDIISGNAYFTLNSMPLFVDSSSFFFEIAEVPTELIYIAVVQQYDSLLTSQRVIGLYNVSNEKHTPSRLYIEPGKTYHITIEVDFDDLPPMPF